MSTTVFHFVIVLTISLLSMVSVSASCTRSITCPCGSTRRADYYTHCLNDTLEEEITCERWASCKTCEANVTHCLTCLSGRSGPTCAEVKVNSKVKFRVRETCPDPGIPEGGSRQNEDGTDDTFTSPRVFLDGESVYFSCSEEDYFLEGRSVITCTSTGTWSDSLPRCRKFGEEKPASEKFCKYPGVDENGIIVNLRIFNSFEDRQMFRSTTRLKFKCKVGYKLKGQSTLFCLCSGEWTSDPPTCVPEIPEQPSLENTEITTNRALLIKDNTRRLLAHCEGRGSISNGRVIEYRDLNRQFAAFEEYGDLYPVGARLHYSCNKGYTLQGAGIVVCESSGLWSANEPKCIQYPNLSQIDEDNQSKDSDSNDENSIRNFVSKQEKRRAGNSNSLIFKFFFL